MDQERLPARSILIASKWQKDTNRFECTHSQRVIEESLKMLANFWGTIVHNETSYGYFGHKDIWIVILYPLFHIPLHISCGLHFGEEGEAFR